MTYYAQRCYTIGRSLNLTTEELFTEAFEQASKCDEQRKRCIDAGKDPFKELGALHGIPFSVKEQLAMKGCSTTLGVPSRAFLEEEEDAVLVEVIKSHGAIPFVRSNVPEICLMTHSTNRIWGTA